MVRISVARGGFLGTVGELTVTLLSLVLVASSLTCVFGFDDSLLLAGGGGAGGREDGVGGRSSVTAIGGEEVVDSRFGGGGGCTGLINDD